VSGTTLNVTQPWRIKPDTTSTYQIGGIQWRWRSQWLKWQENQSEGKGTRSVSVRFRPTDDASQLDLRVYRDLSTTPEPWPIKGDPALKNGIAPRFANSTDLSFDTTKTNGYVRQELGGSVDKTADGPRFVSVELVGCPNTDRQGIFSVTLDGAGE
jgi:hypothetical protein